MSERMQYQAKDGSAKCINCGETLSFHEFDQTVPTYYCKAIYLRKRNELPTIAEAAKVAERCSFADVTANRIEVPVAEWSGSGYAQLAKDYEVAAEIGLPKLDTVIGSGKMYVKPPVITAPDILKRAAQHMEDRAAARDQPGGERSMQRTVDAFNALTGHELSERDGWMFMVALKAARACTTPTGLSDDYEDGAAYFGLAGEAAQR